MKDKKEAATLYTEEFSNLKKRIQQLEASEKRYREFVENVEDACLEMDLSGNFTFGNDALFKTGGYTREEHLQMKRWQLFPTREEADRIANVYSEIYRTGIPRKIIDYLILHKDGSVRNISASVSLIRDEEGNPVGFRGTGRDVTEQKKIEAEQERYRNFVENIEDFCFEVDLAGNFTFVNRAMLNRFGYTKEEALGMNFNSYIKSEELPNIYSEFNALYKTGKPLPLISHEIVHKDGSTITLELSISLIFDAHGKTMGFRGISRDVTENRKMVAKLERYQNFVENVYDICWESDLEGNFTFVNSAALRKLGFSREDLKKVNYRQYTAPEEARRISTLYRDMYQTGIPAKIINHEIILSDGQIRYLELSVSLIRDAAGSPAGVRGIARDVTERKKMESEQERFRTFFENIEDGCWEIDLQGYCTFCNKAVLDQFGYAAEEVKNITSTDYTTPEERERLRGIYQEMFRTGKPVKVHDQEIVRKDGSVRFLEVSASVIRDASGTIIGARGINRDVTERKRMKIEQEKMMAQFNQAQKIESLGTLSGGIAHDFNNLLMGIQGYASLMLCNTDPTHPHYEKLKAIESQVQSGANLTKQLLGYARSGRYEVNPINLNDIIQKTTNLFGRTKKEIRLFEKYGESLWLVEADGGQLEQVFLNLFVNAWQAMPGGGSLYVETQNVTLDESYIKPYDVTPGLYVRVTIADTGVGMDKETQQRIFEPFFTTKTMGRGTGLGLASVYGIIKGHKGIINVYSEKGHGTSFNIYLPISKKMPIHQEPVVSEIRSGHETILLVDDENVITDVTSQMLSALGYQILVADGGEKAIEIYRENHDRIDLVIMDMIMPVMGGGETFSRIKAINPKVKVILSSGYTLNSEAKEIMKQGVLAFLQKPYNQDELSRKIREIMINEQQAQ
jgi:two-component system, cell cycle sensor histidine kinase and response regulator CckA